MLSDVMIQKGWGYEKWIINSNMYCGKILHFNEGKKCSWHFHKIKDETFYVAKGSIELKYSYENDLDGAESLILNEGQSFHVPVLMRHQMKGLTESEIFEISTEHFEEDSYRVIRGD